MRLADTVAPNPAEICDAPLLLAQTSGALWAPGARALAVADLHLGKSTRLARRGDALLPPYETDETLERLEADVAAFDPAVVLCVGDSFDDQQAAEDAPDALRERLSVIAAGRDLIWIAGNHDPAPHGLPGRALASVSLGGAVYRHIASAAPEAFEVSGHYHPKATLAARGRRVTRRAFLADSRRVILPAFGVYTGGLDAREAPFDALFGAAGGRAILLGAQLHAAPRARLAPRR